MARRPSSIALVVLLALSVAAEPAVGQKPAKVRPDSAILVDTVVALEKKFLARWGFFWRSAPSEQLGLGAGGEYGGDGGTRAHNLHCHPDMVSGNSASNQGRLIGSRNTYFAVCPSWDLGEVRTPSDERVWLDTALNSAYRAGAHDTRNILLDLLDSAARILPSNDFIAGQRVRFLIDQRDYDRAQRVADECAASRWWCAALSGYVHAVRGQVVAADSAFATSLTAMSDRDRCEWTDVRMLFEPNGRAPYSRLSCAKRDLVNARVWWLSDPLFIEAGNGRRVEHYARRVLLALRMALDRDERFDWREHFGSDAREAMVMRYGWPSLVIWGGSREDSSHTGYLRTHTSPPNEPYTTYEYSSGRAHAVPVWSAIDDPFHAAPRDWSVSEPIGAERPVLPPRVGANGRIQPVEWVWWPAEHFAPSRPLVQLPDGQHALLRRQDSLLLAVATDLGAERLNRRVADTIPRIAMVLSEKPDVVQRIGEATGVVGASLVMTGMVSSRPTLVGLEFAALNTRGPPGGRLRFGVTPPAPLSALRPGAVAVSDPILLRVPASVSTLPNDIDAVLQLMSPTTRVGATRQIGVYWETYGFLPTDTVEVAVWIERHTNQGIVRRFGIALRVATDLNTPIAISWKEPQPSVRASYLGGLVPIIGRSVILDTSKLPKGDYWLDVAIRKPGQDPVRGRTGFVVQ